MHSEHPATTSWGRWAALGLVIIVGLSVACKKDDDEKSLLGTIRLFLVDDANQWIRVINAESEILLNFFPAPTAQVSSSGVALGFNNAAKILYFMDPSEPDTIYRILPDQSGPGNVDAAPLPEQILFPYEGFGFDTNWLLAVDPVANIVDALDAGTGSIEGGSTSFCPDPLDTPNCFDLLGGFDATLAMGIFAVGVDNGTGQKALYHLDSQGRVLGVFLFEPGFDPQGIAVARNFVFASDVATRKIRVFEISGGAPRVLTEIKSIDFPQGSTITAIAAGG